MSKLMLALAALAVSAPAALADDPPQRTITVAGNAAVTAANDTAGFTTGVSVRRSGAADALHATSARMQRVLAALEAQGVARRDIRTEHVGVARVRRHHVVAYVGTSSVFVTVRAIQRTGSVIDAAVQAGANRLSGPSFWRSSTSDLYQRALIAALRKARAKAEALAAEAGATLGAVQTITEGDVPAYSYDSSGASAKAPAPVRPGRTKVTADIAVVYTLE
jgi:uncharacterized protein YggE